MPNCMGSLRSAGLRRRPPPFPAARALREPAHLLVERFEVDLVGVEEPLEEEPVERRDGDRGEAAAPDAVGDDPAQALGEEVAEAAVELPQAGAELGASLGGLEDEVEDHTAELRAPSDRLRVEAPGRLASLVERRKREDVARGPARDLLEDPLGDPEEKLLLRPEVPENRALRDADRLGQDVERRPVYPARGEETERGLQDRLLGPYAASLSGARHRGGSGRAGRTAETGGRHELC